jgi:hypothetical protein
MAAKFDKEMMKKQHFWLLLIPLVIGIILAWVGLFSGVSDAIETAAADNDKERKSVESAKAQSKKTLELYDSRKEELFKLRTQRWKEMWDLQQAIQVWPDSLSEDQIAKVKDRKFGDEISDQSFMNAFRDLAMKGYDQLATTASPLQFAGDWRSVLRNVPAWKRNPESEDIWLAMEDYWVQRELVLAMAGVNKDAAQFKRPDELAANDSKRSMKNEPRERTFIGRTWQLELVLNDKPGGATIEGFVTNLTPRLQPYNATGELVFNVWLSSDLEARPFRFAVEGTSQAGGTREKIKFVAKKHTVLEGRVVELHKVEQVFDVRTAPVKRIDALRLGATEALSARQSQADLQMTAFSTKAVEAADKEAAASGMGGGTGMGPSGPMTGGPASSGSAAGPPPGIGATTAGGPSGGTGTAANSNDYTYNGLARKRYVHITSQVRAMPIGLVVVADQGFTQDVLTAVANCKLRFQTVQTTLRRFRGTLSYAMQTAGPTGPPMGGRPMGEEGSPGGVPGPGPMPPRPGGTSVAGPPGPGGPTSAMPPGPGPGMLGGLFGTGGAISSSDDQAAGSLVVVGVYGIAALYEKFEEAPAKKDDATGAATTAPKTTTPGPTGTTPGTTTPMPMTPPGTGTPDAKTPDAKAPDAKAPDAKTPTPPDAKVPMTPPATTPDPKTATPGKM